MCRNCEAADLAEATGQGECVRVRRRSSSDSKALVAAGSRNLGFFEGRFPVDNATFKDEGLDDLNVRLPSGDVKDETGY